MNLDNIIIKTYDEITIKLYKKKVINYAPPLRITTGNYRGESDYKIKDNGSIELIEIRISKIDKEWIKNKENRETVIFHELAHGFEEDCKSQKHKDIMYKLKMIFEN